ncbi:hypothetical protein GPALN_007425 [Globodera pallida]|nr:hypothetical protein GPALN_007425 [Globodera pallida]
MVRSSSRPRRPIKRYVDELNDASGCNKKVRRTLPPPRIFSKASAGSPLQGKFVSSISSFIKSTAAGAEKVVTHGPPPHCRSAQDKDTRVSRNSPPRNIVKASAKLVDYEEDEDANDRNSGKGVEGARGRRPRGVFCKFFESLIPSNFGEGAEQTRQFGGGG